MMMMTKKKKKRVPELRFEGFEGEWDKRAIEEILTIGSGKDYKHLQEGDIPVYGTGGLMTKVNDYLYDGESIGIGRKGTIDKPVYLNGKFWTVDTLFYTHSFIESVPMFIFNQFQRINWYRYNEASGVPSLSKKTIEKININTPKIEEQQKIATFLTSIDTRIQQLEKKKTLLDQYKKGVMQKIFSQKIRFKTDSGEEFGEWEKKRLGEMTQIKTGKLDANAMVEDGTYRFYTCAKDYYRIDNFAFDTEALLISGNGANVGYIHYYKGKFNAYQRTYVLDDFSENIFYIKYYLQKHLSTRIEREKKDGNTPYIVLGTLTEMKIEVPCLAEQTKIAHFLFALDRKIAVVDEQIEGMKEWKKGLLQRMFV